MLPSGSGIGSERAREAIILSPRATRESSSLPGASMRAQARSRRASRPHAREPRIWETRPSRVSHPIPRISAADLARAIRRQTDGVLEAPSPAEPQPIESIPPTPPCVLIPQSTPAMPIVPAGASAADAGSPRKTPHPSNCAQNAAGRDEPRWGRRSARELPHPAIPGA